VNDGELGENPEIFPFLKKGVGAGFDTFPIKSDVDPTGLNTEEVLTGPKRELDFMGEEANPVRTVLFVRIFGIETIFSST